MTQFAFKGKSNPKIVSLVDSDVSLKFNLNKRDFNDYDVFCKFVEGVMLLVRKDARYTNYKGVLYRLGLNRCQYFSGITDEMAPLEMHHGPIFNLFDICSIVTDHLIDEGEEVNTMMVADIVLKEHEKHNIQLVMLCETAHEGADNGSIFLNYKQGFGFLDRFVKKYKKGLRREHLDTLKDYMKLSAKHNATDNGVFEIIERVKKWIKKE
jgi:hypothetical protein